MAWLDDRAWCHPKLVNLSDKGYRAYINALAYSAGMGLRGVLTAPQQRLMGATPGLRSELVESGLWDEMGGSIRIHDWDAHNGKRDERRARDKERKRAKRLQERQQVRPQDSPQDAPQLRRALKEVKEVTVVKKEGEPNGSLVKKREPNPIWDALVEVFGEPSTDSARTLRGKVCSSLSRAGATPGEIVSRCKSWPRHFDHATLTETALEKHWDALGRSPMRVSR